MNSFIRRAAMAVLLASAAAFTVSMPPAYAADKAPPKAQILHKEVFSSYSDAIKLFQMKDFAGALAKLQAAEMFAMKTPFETYVVAKLHGIIAISQPMQDFPAAIAAYEAMAASGGAPDMEKGDMYAILMKLHYQEKQYAQVIQDGAELEKIEPLDSQTELLLSQSYYLTNDFKNAAMAAKAVIAAATAKGEKPTEVSLRLLLTSQLKLMDDAGARDTLDQLAMVSTQPDVWDQEIGYVFNVKGISDHHLLNLYRLSLALGSMRDSDYKAMATIDLKNGLPSEAKAVLTKGNISGDLMNQTNTFLAKDQGVLTALVAEAAKQKNGDIDVTLGESYLTYGRNDEAVAAIQKGIAKGGFKDLADAETTLGIALFNAGKKPEAQAAFDMAAMANSPAASVAHVWSLYVRRSAA